MDLPGQQPAPATLQSSGDALSVFNIDGNSLFGNKTHQIDFNALGSEETIVINVSGKDINLNTNFVGVFTQDNSKQKVVWNFFEAENITFNREFHGSVLAPFAHLVNTNNIEGTVVVKSFDQRGEVHQPVFRADLPED